MAVYVTQDGFLGFGQVDGYIDIPFQVLSFFIMIFRYSRFDGDCRLLSGLELFGRGSARPGC